MEVCLSSFAARASRLYVAIKASTEHDAAAIMTAMMTMTMTMTTMTTIMTMTMTTMMMMMMMVRTNNIRILLDGDSYCM